MALRCLRLRQIHASWALLFRLCLRHLAVKSKSSWWGDLFLSRNCVTAFQVIFLSNQIEQGIYFQFCIIPFLLLALIGHFHGIFKKLFQIANVEIFRHVM